MLCFGLGEERGNFLSLVYIQQIENIELFCSVSFLHSSTFHTLFLPPCTSHQSFQRHSLVSHKMTSSAVWAFESMSYDHPSSPIHTQSCWFSWFCTFPAGARRCFEQFAVCPFCGVVWLLALPSQPKEERAGHKKLLGLWEKKIVFPIASKRVVWRWASLRTDIPSVLGLISHWSHQTADAFFCFQIVENKMTYSEQSVNYH